MIKKVSQKTMNFHMYNLQQTTNSQNLKKSML